MEDEAFADARASYDETLAREIVNECAATARARAASEDALGAVREALRGATKRASASEERADRGLVRARRRSVMKTY